MSELKEKSSSLAATIFYLVSIITAPMFYIYALLIDFKHDHFAYFAADLVVPPIGMIHGLILFIWGP